MATEGRTLRGNMQELRCIRGKLVSFLIERMSPRKQKFCTAKIIFTEFIVES